MAIPGLITWCQLYAPGHAACSADVRHFLVEEVRQGVRLRIRGCATPYPRCTAMLRYARTDFDGVYRFAYVTPGHYWVELPGHGFSGGSAVSPNHHWVDVSRDPSAPSEANFVRFTPVRLEGSVATNSDNTRVRLVRISDLEVIVETRPNNSGWFFLAPPSGDYRLELVVDGVVQDQLLVGRMDRTYIRLGD